MKGEALFSASGSTEVTPFSRIYSENSNLDGNLTQKIEFESFFLLSITIGIFKTNDSDSDSKKVDR